MGRIEKNAAQVARFIEHVWPHLERSCSIPEVPFDRKAKGASHPPVGDKALKLMDDTREAARYINPAIEELMRHNVKWRGVPFREILGLIRYDAGIIRRWKAAQTNEDRLYGEAYWKMCLLIARALMARYEGLDLSVKMNANDEAANTPRQAESRRRSIDARHSYRLIVQGVEHLESIGYSREAAKSKRAEELMCSIGRIEKAITFVNQERNLTKLSDRNAS